MSELDSGAAVRGLKTCVEHRYFRWSRFCRPPFSGNEESDTLRHMTERSQIGDISVAALSEKPFPFLEWLHGPTGWSAVLSSAENSSFKNRLRIGQQSIDHVPRDTAQWYLQAATPT